MCLLFHFHLLCQYFIHLGKPLKSTGGANLSDTLPPFQLILVGVHWRQLGQRLENLVQRVPGMSTAMHKLQRGTAWVARLPSHLWSQRQCGTIMELLQYKTNPFMWIIHALCLHWSSISELHAMFPTHIGLVNPLEKYLVVVIWEPTLSALNRHRRSAIYCVTIPLLHALLIVSLHSLNNNIQRTDWPLLARHHLLCMYAKGSLHYKCDMPGDQSATHDLPLVGTLMLHRCCHFLGS